MNGLYIHRGACRPVAFDLGARCRAVRELLRPEEVAELWSHRGAQSANVPRVDQVAAFFRAMFRQHRLEYVHDPMLVDCWCSPGRTLERGYGDCDDLAILAAAVLIAGNIEAKVVLGSAGNTRQTNHAWVEGVDEFGRSFFYEATSPTLMYGARPLSYVPHAMIDRRSCTDLRPRPKQVDWQKALGAAMIGAGAAILAAGLIDDDA